MTDIIEAFDAYMIARFIDKGLKPYGLAELIKKGSSVQPVHVTTRQHIAINDKWDGQWYHRIISSGKATSEEDSFGSTEAKVQTVRLRTVFATKHKMGELIRYSFARTIPDILTVEGYRRVDFSNDLTMIEDQEGVYNQEWGAGDYEKHATAWNIVAMEYDVSFIACATTVC